MNSVPPDIAERLQNPVERIRYDALKELVSLRGKEATPILLQALTDSGPPVRALAIRNLAAFGGVEFADQLLPFLAESNQTVQKNVVDAFRNMGIAAMPHLLTAIQSSNAAVRSSAAATT